MPPFKGHRHSQYTPKTPPQTPSERGWFFQGVSGEREQRSSSGVRGFGADPDREQGVVWAEMVPLGKGGRRI
jgi:hypothetical protein